MDKRIGTISILMEEVTPKVTSIVNKIISEHNDIVRGRMGMPFHERNCGVISLIIAGSNDEVSALCGKLGKIEGVNVRSLLLSK